MSRIEQILESFEGIEPGFRLELLLEYADRFPALPDGYRERENLESHRLHECQTPVSLWVEVEAGKVHIHADVPPESPTVRGFLTLMMEAFNNASPQDVLAAPLDVLTRSGLIHVIGMRRAVGLDAVYRHIKREVAKKA